MNRRKLVTLESVLLTTVCVCAMSVAAQDATPGIPESKIKSLEAELANKEKGVSSTRRRRECKNIVRDAEDLLEAHPAAPNRYRVLGLILQSRKELFSLEKTARNRDALFETCRQLAKAPDEYAAVRLDADLLLSERDLAQKRATRKERAEAIRTLIARYRNTPAEAESLMIASLMAMKIGDSDLLEDARRTMSKRRAGDLKLIEFQRARLDSRILGAPFRGTYMRADGTSLCFPMDCMGHSSLLFFWSKEEADIEHRVAEWKALQDELPGLFKAFSFNLDDLPDAGEKMLRTWGLDWTAMRLPGGRNSQAYRAYARKDPVGVHVSPTGYAALLPDMKGKVGIPAMRSYLQKNTRYLSQLQSLFLGEFLVIDPSGPFDPALPPEVKTISPDDAGKDAGARLNRTAASVPEETLRAIQACFIAPPLRYRLPRKEVLANYEKAEALCREAIEQHPQAPDLWLVRNRRIIALLGMWKLASDPQYLKRAAKEAHAALALDLHRGAQIVPQFCLAKGALRQDDADPESVLGTFIESAEEAGAPGSALAAAAILALDACVPNLHHQYRQTLLKEHSENPMAWTVLSFLRDRFHRFYLFRAPYYYGRISSRRRTRYFVTARPEETNRLLKADLKNLDGSTFKIPRDTSGKWALILFMTARNEAAGRSYQAILKQASGIVKSRASKDINVIAALLSDDTTKVSAMMKENSWEGQTVLVPGGIRNPLVHRLGILSEDLRPNIVLLRPDGVIAVELSGLLMSEKGAVSAIQNSIAWHEDKSVDEALKNGDLQEAKRLALGAASPDKDRKKTDTTHLRTRAKVYAALKKWDAALADIEEAILRQKQSDGRAAMKSREAVEAMRIRATIRDGLGQPDFAREDRRIAEDWEQTVMDDE